MDAAAALERLQEISSQVRAAVIFERGGKVVGSTFADDQRAKDVAEEAEALLTEAEQRHDAGGETAEFAQLEVALQGGSVFVVRDGDRLIAATTQPEPTVGLVFYDLKSCLRDLDTPAAPKKRAAPRRKPASRAKKTDAKS
ncbi:MAG TPA: roadblock/LC7 domain-containing protein [Gaiellaceae bacterium]|nr:roadblock/LC7 domain-containing protein [Gaiellaceae bacterium]